MLLNTNIEETFKKKFKLPITLKDELSHFEVVKDKNQEKFLKWQYILILLKVGK